MRGVALAGSACACALMAYAVRGRSSTLLAPSVYRGSRRRRAIALTFDDGPSERTNQLLASRILSRTETGAIICLHDGRGVRANPDIGPTLEAVERIIPVLQSRGYIFETVSQILCPNN